MGDSYSFLKDMQGEWKLPDDSVFSPPEKNKKTAENLIDDFLAEVRKTLIERAGDYGNAMVSFQRIADVWSFLKIDVLNDKLTSQDVATMMIAMKLCRLETTPNHRDSLIDIAGYACLASLM